MRRQIASLGLTAILVIQLILAPLAQAADQNKSVVKTIKIDPGAITTIQTSSGLVNLSDLNSKSQPKLVIQSPEKPSGPICGGANQPRCAKKPAKFASAALGKCPTGTFFDIGTWQCWSCPKGFKRTAWAVDSAKACSKPNKSIRGEFMAASFEGPVCPKGTFYDGIRDGECRKCPKGYKRSAAHVDAKNACFVPAREEFKRITKHRKGTGLLGTDCPKGQFWDGIDGYCYSCPSGFNRTGYSVRDAKACSRRVKEKQAKAEHVQKGTCSPGEFRDATYQRDGDGGTCWTCPKTSDRTVYAVHGKKACEKGGGLEFKDATKKADLTCPAGQAFDFIGLSANDIKTRPETKKMSGLKPIKSGTCWSCDSGYDRTLSGVKSKDACEAKSMVWYSQPYEEPGLFGLKGAEDVLLDITRRHPQLIATSIEETAKAASESNKKLTYAKALSMETELFRTTPHKSTAAAAAVLVRVMAAIGEPKHASAAEKQLLKSFSAHITAKRTHVAEDALAAYEGWKKADTYWRAKGSRGNGLQTMLDYGTVPPDYSTVAMMNSLAVGSAGTAIGIATGSIPILGDVLGVTLGAAGNGFADFSDAESIVKFGATTAAELALGKAIEFAIESMAKTTIKTLTSQAVKNAGYLAAHRAAGHVAKEAGTRMLSLAGGAGPQIIISAAFMIGQVALDQVFEIANAKPKLLNAIAHAKRSPNLARMVKSAQGNGELLGYWSFLISTEKKPSAAFTKAFAPAADLATKAMASSDTAKKKATKTAPAKKMAAKSAASFNANGKWHKMPGAAIDVGAGPAGRVVVIGKKGGVFRWNAKKNNWDKLPGTLARVDVTPQGNPVGVNAKGEIWALNGEKWTKLPGAAKDIGVGADGTTWVIGTKAVNGGFEIFRWKKGKFSKVKGAAVRIDVDSKGNAWAVSDNGKLFHYTGKNWKHEAKAPKAQDVAVGANGSLFLLATDGTPYRKSGGKWVKMGGKANNITADANGTPWVINSKMDIFAWK
ncbi:exported protein of unknown function [Magnetospira sp. QH-2]|nr:exported protein of unknown function [Magnetospira sp. QH-2]